VIPAIDGVDPFAPEGGDIGKNYKRLLAAAYAVPGRPIVARGRYDVEAGEELSLVVSQTQHAHERLPELFPEPLPPAPPVPRRPKDRKPLWPEEALKIAQALKQTIDLTKLDGGLVIQEQHDSLDAHRQRVTSRTTGLRLVSGQAWLSSEAGDAGGPRINWADQTERGVFSRPFELTLIRKSAPTDLPQEYSAGQWWQANLDRHYQDHRTVEIQRPADGRVLLAMKHVIHPHDEIRVLIDTTKNVALSFEAFAHGKSIGGTRLSELVEVAGLWLAQRVEHFDEQGRAHNVMTRKYTTVAQARLVELMKEQLAPRGSALALAWPLPSLADAKDRIGKGQGTLESRLTVLLDLAARQKWPEATEELGRCERLAGNKYFAVWLRAWLLRASRRHEELRQLALQEAQSLAQKPRPGEFALVERLHQFLSEFSEAEQLSILDALQPIYARLPEHMQGPRLWAEVRRNALGSADRRDEEIALLRELVRDYPDTHHNHRFLADRLSGQGDVPAAIDVLKAALARPGANWPPGERDYLYEAWADLLQRQGRYADQAALLAEWLKLNPEGADPYERYLAALIYARREGEADKLIAQWLRAGLAEAPLPRQVVAQADAAVETALGDNSYCQGGDPFAWSTAPPPEHSWLPSLLELMLAHVDSVDQPRFVSKISSEWSLRRTDQYRAAARMVLVRLKAQAATLPPARLDRLIDWCNAYASGSDDDWRAIAAAVRPRWEAAEQPAIRKLLAESLLTVLGRISRDERLAFLRLRMERSADEERAAHVAALFDALLESDWTAAVEAESLALIDDLSAADEAADRLPDQIVALYRWVDRMEQARQEKLNAEIERPDKLTRTELDDKRKELLSQVRRDLIARLKAAAATREDGLKKWIQLEQLTLQARLEQALPQVVENCWELLGPAPAAAIGNDWSAAAKLEAAFRARIIAMLMQLAIRKEAPAPEIERLTKFLDQSLALDATVASTGLDARLAKYALLVALDQPQELIEQLAAWSQGGDRPQLWQRTLAYLRAELGQLDEAVTLVEPLAESDALEAGDYRVAAGWYQALKRDEKYSEMLVAAWKQLDEWRLRNVVQAHMRPWENSRGPTPGTIDPQVFLVLKALFEKANDPADHVHLARSFYEKSRDFRLLASLADAVIGQSSGKIYRFLKELDSALDEIDREATVDELLAHVAKVRQRAKAPVDQRALDLLTMLVEARSAELQNQPGPHVAAAVAALQRATSHEWSPGEPRLFAQLLADLGNIPQQPLSAERIRVIRSLHEAVRGQPLDRLLVAHALADALMYDGRRQEAIEVLEPSLAEHRRARSEKLTWEALDSLRRCADFLADGGNFVRAEQTYRSELARAANEKVASEIRVAIHRLHAKALEEQGRTSLGDGAALFRAARGELIAELMTLQDQQERKQLIERLCELHRAAQRREISQAGADAAAFGRSQLPVLLGRQVDNYQDIVEQVERTIRETAGYLPALDFLVTRMESEPAWLARRGDDGWRRFAWELGILHDEVRGKLGDLEPRFLRIVLAALRQDLASQNERRRVIYHDGSTHFWKERSGDFARLAEEVLAQQRDSQRAVMYIAEFLYAGIDRHDRGIEVLLDAHRRKLLDDDGQSRLVAWLQEQDRFGESIAFLEPLVQQHPERLVFRLQLLRAYFQTKQPAALQKLLSETDKYFRAENRWSDGMAGHLAGSCLENQLLGPAIEYLKEAIQRREEALRGRTAGDRTLAQYYVDRAYAYAGLENTAAAVDDACSAIVVWGAAGDGLHRRNARTLWRQAEQVHPLDVLRNVLADSPDLDAYVAALDAQTADSQQDRPIVRKILGEVYFQRNAFEKALVQLKLAVELAPADGALHARLVECYDALMMHQQAAEQLFASVELARRDIELWVQLARRLEKLEQPADAERALTSLVELLPSETEGHAQLAEIRQEQGRWDEAIEHWRHVARIRKLEPAGLLGLAAAQIQQRQRAEAAKTIQELERTDWPARFHDDLRQKQLPKLRAELDKLK
jgi:tetratricopeptide (TPR) repeat protein